MNWRPAVHVDQQARSYSCCLPPVGFDQVDIDQVDIDQADDQLVEVNYASNVNLAGVSADDLFHLY